MNSCSVYDLINSPKQTSKQNTNFMNITSLTEKLNGFFNSKALFNVARESNFLQRSRQIIPMSFLLSFIETLGCQSKANLADIHRKYQATSGMPIQYKPFHNQIKKSQCADFFERCFNNVMEMWVLQSLKLTSLSTGGKFPFSQIKLHDGCSFGIHSGLKGVYPGRFSKHTPAAIELHITMDLLSGGIDYFGLTPDTESERLHAPKPESLKNVLLLTDAGYFERNEIIKIDKHGGFTISQTACSINPTVKQAFNFNGEEVPEWSEKRLKTLKLKDNNETLDLTVRWPGYEMDFRVIAFWYKKKKRIGYLVTNLPRDTVPAADVVELYRLRWQIELLFKELKSYCNLKKFSTQNKSLVTTLIYASFITVLLKRLMAFSTEQLKSIWISTQKSARAASNWLAKLVRGLIQESHITAVVTDCVEIIAKLCQRAHPKRDLENGLYQFGVSSLVDI